MNNLISFKVFSEQVPYVDPILKLDSESAYGSQFSKYQVASRLHAEALEVFNKKAYNHYSVSEDKIHQTIWNVIGLGSGVGPLDEWNIINEDFKNVERCYASLHAAIIYTTVHHNNPLTKEIEDYNKAFSRHVSFVKEILNQVPSFDSDDSDSGDSDLGDTIPILVPFETYTTISYPQQSSQVNPVEEGDRKKQIKKEISELKREIEEKNRIYFEYYNDFSGNNYNIQMEKAQNYKMLEISPLEAKLEILEKKLKKLNPKTRSHGRLMN
jgi:hypothetical protein